MQIILQRCPCEQQSVRGIEHLNRLTLYLMRYSSRLLAVLRQAFLPRICVFDVLPSPPSFALASFVVVVVVLRALLDPFPLPILLVYQIKTQNIGEKSRLAMKYSRKADKNRRRKSPSHVYCVNSLLSFSTFQFTHLHVAFALLPLLVRSQS